MAAEGETRVLGTSDLDTRCHAPVSGHTLFRLSPLVSLPPLSIDGAIMTMQMDVFAHGSPVAAVDLLDGGGVVL